MQGAKSTPKRAVKPEGVQEEPRSYQVRSLSLLSLYSG